jgi:hypothetical protein
MSRYPVTAALPPADQRKHQSAVIPVTSAPSLTSAVTSNGKSAACPGFADTGLSGVVLAATATPHLSVLGVVLVVLVLAVAWVIRVWLWPFGPCAKCEGNGKNIGSNGKRWGTCPRCKGTGRRLRTGARLVHRIIVRKEVK